MSRKNLRRGIERRIVASILWIGLVPVVITLAVGYMAVYGWRGRVAQEGLESSVIRTARSMQSGAAAYLDLADYLAAHPQIKHVDGAGSPSAGEAGSGYSRLLPQSGATEKVPEGFPLKIAVYDASGRETWGWGRSSWEHLAYTPPEFSETACYGGIQHDAVSGVYYGTALAPVHGTGNTSTTPSGMVVVFFDAGIVISRALGDNQPIDYTDDRSEARRQFALMDQATGHLMVADIAYLDGSRTLALGHADPKLEQALRQDRGEGVQFRRFTQYQAPGAGHATYTAWAMVFPGAYLIAYQPVKELFWEIHLGAALAFGLSVATLSLLCLAAYRYIHNNIVRNILLLNEGARVIERGDLELKLKISTGDELEQLATSFNRMAQALRKNMRQLRESERRCRGLVTSMRDGIVQTDLEGCIALVNPVGAGILGFDDPSELMGRSMASLMPDPHELEPVARKLRKHGFVERLRITALRRDGKRICLEISGNWVLDEAGQTIGIEGVFRDITHSVELEKEARERAERIAAINQIANAINSSLQAGLLYESLVIEARKLVDFDYASLALLDEEGLRFSMRQLWPEQPHEAPRTCAADDETFAAPLVARMEKCLCIADLATPGRPPLRDFTGEARSCLCVPLYATGKIIGSLNLGASQPDAFSAHDVEVMEQMAPNIAVAIRNASLLEHLQASLEEVTKAQAQLRDANDELKTLDEMKTNLLSNVSHELRTPLVAVMGYTDMIFNGKAGPTTEAQQEYLRIILRNIEKLVTLIENLLDFSRLHRGTETLVFDTFDLLDCAQSSIEIVRPTADGREISVTLKGPSEPVWVEGDKGQLSKVFNNLLSNAVKFNHHGGSVTVELALTSDSVETIVSDTGIGMPREALDRIFTRFYQLDGSSTRKYGGTGIGLSIAQDIVQLHGSRITVTSEPGKGSMFRFSLPIKKTRSRSSTETAGNVRQVSETGLLLELVTTDRVLVKQMRSLLDSEGVDIVVAGGLSKAVSLVEKYRPDCILIDMENEPVSATVLDDLLDDPVAAQSTVILFTSDEELAERYHAVVSSHIKPGFRKSFLLSAIRYAVRQGAGGAEAPGHKILLVDDDAEVLGLMRRLLEGEGYDVDQSTTGQDALNRLSTGEYGIVLLDIAMPGMDGWEVCRRIKTDPALAGVKVYMVTAKPAELGSVRSQDAGSDGYLVKPFKPEDLLELVRQFGAFRTGRGA